MSTNEEDTESLFDSVRTPSQCQYCTFWKRNAEDSEWGECRRYPPQVLDYDEEEVLVMSTHPVLQEKSWCGEFRAR